MSDILKTQHSFARKATTEPEHRFEDLYHLLCKREWIAIALENVLANQGARTPGVDGMTKTQLETIEQQVAFIAKLQTDLKSRTFTPSPVRRVWIPKPGKPEKRGLGVPTLADKVVQEQLRMLMEPIWESDFLDCSHGFRPGRQTMDCIVTFWSHANRLQKYYWIIEGDIRKCFDRVNHTTLMKLVKRRIADDRILTLIERFLKAGVLEEGLFQETPEGTPQGGILSPLLANIYLNELDQWWWRTFGGRTRNEKRRNRNAGNGNAILTRYTDDFCILWNGSREGALALREELRQFLWDELHLELSVEKTQVTHLDDGIDFLGFHIQRETPSDNKPWIRITPTQENVRRYRARIKQLTRYNTTFMPVADKLRLLNRLILGWGNYYRGVNFSHDAKELDWWTNRRVLIWLKAKHNGLGVRAILDLYKVREKYGKKDRWNFAAKDGQGKMVYLTKMTDIRSRRYRPHKRPNPYLSEEICQHIPLTIAENPFTKTGKVNYTPENTEWLETRQTVLERDNYHCVKCGKSSPPFYVHHLVARKDNGADDFDNLQTLCKKCHVQTESYGRNRTGRKVQEKAV